MASEQLKKWLADNGYSQTDFAKTLNRTSRRVHVDQTEVSRWVRRKRLPNEAEQQTIERVTGIARSLWKRDSAQDWSE